MRVICAGQILEDISDYGRLHQMFHMMKPSEARMNDAIEGFGVSETLVTTLNNADEASTLAKDEKQTICFTPLSGSFYRINFCPVATAHSNLNSKSLEMQMTLCKGQQTLGMQRASHF